MSREVIFLSHTAELGGNYLLQHYAVGKEQEELCFGLWRPSTGKGRKSAIIYEVIKPKNGERNLHGNASFEPEYLTRAIKKAIREGAGLAFLHSHPSNGWQDMSREDEIAERDVISYPARATKHPLVGLTIGRDGYWSARWWENNGKKVKKIWCEKVRVVGRKKYELYRKPKNEVKNKWSKRLRRTKDSWGKDFQKTIENMAVGIVGVGSVGCIVAEAMGRIGIGKITLIDGDRLDEHNLDRFLYGDSDKIGEKKVNVAAEKLRKISTNSKCIIDPIDSGIEYEEAYKSALDCDLLFSCVDKPVARDVLNYIAQAHMIPVIDAGVAVEVYKNPTRFFGAHWRAHVITPEHQCLRCTGQYNSGDVVAELDGSLSDPQYIKGLEESGVRQNMNTFPFALGAAGIQVNLALRYLLGEAWWPSITRQEYQFVKGEMSKKIEKCYNGCNFREMVGMGDEYNPPYLYREEPKTEELSWKSKVSVAYKKWKNKLLRNLLGHDI